MKSGTNVGIANPDLLKAIPAGLRQELLDAHSEIIRNFREQRWEPSELNGGKLCEVAISVLQGQVRGQFPARALKPRNMVDACRELENAPGGFPRSVRIQIPRMLMALYEIRNNRGVGHVGGDVDPNHMDAMCVLQMSKWVMSELIRVFHDVSTDEATKAVDALVDRTIPIVWGVGEKFRILDPTLSMKDRSLLLLYHRNFPVSESDLCNWVEHSNPTAYRRDVLRKAHQQKLVEYDSSTKMVELSPKGVAYVEESLLVD